MKYVFFAKICFMKTSTRIMKYESRVVKWNPDSSLLFQPSLVLQFYHSF